MESPIHHKTRRALLIVVAVVAVAILGTLAYRFMVRARAERIEREHQALLDAVAAQSQEVSAGIPDAEKAAILDAVAAGSAGTSGTPALSDAEKAAILESVSN